MAVFVVGIMMSIVLAAFTMQDCCDLCRKQNEPAAICDIAELWHAAGSKTGETDHRRVALNARCTSSATSPSIDPDLIQIDEAR
eukprot:COSAG06_NODE_16626_length_990_cov_0.961841_2_plen_84_part_00